MVGIKYGIGKHIELVDAYSQQQFFRVLYAYNHVYVATAPSIKISVLLMYKRVFPTYRFKKVVNVFSAIIFVWWLAEALVAVFDCWPINAYWNKRIEHKCQDIKTGQLQYAVFNIGFDVLILALPVRMVLKLHLSPTRKIAVVAVFLLGSLSVVRVHFATVVPQS